MSTAKTSPSALEIEALESEGRWGEAEAAWRTRLSKGPTEVTPWAGLARAAGGRGRWEEAIHFIHVATLNARGDAGARRLLATTASRLGFGTLALDLLSSGQGLEAETWFQKADLQIELRMFPEATASAAAALAAGADAGRVTRLQATIRTRQGTSLAARSLLRDHLLENPDDLDAEALFARALFLADTPDLRAYAPPEAALAEHPTLDLERRAALAEHDGDIRGALALYRQVADLAPALNGLWRKLGILSLRLQDPIGAKAAALRLIELSPCDPEGYVTLASAGRTPAEDCAAAERLQHYAACNPFNRTVVAGLFAILLRRHDHDRLLKVAASLDDSQLKTSDAFSVDLAEAESGAGDLASAVARLKALPAPPKGPPVPATLLRVARAARLLATPDRPALLLRLWPDLTVAFGAFDLARRQRDFRTSLGWAEAIVQAGHKLTSAQWGAFVGVAASAGRQDLMTAWCAAGRVPPPLRTAATAERLPLDSRDAAIAYRDLQARLQERKATPERSMDAAERLLSFGHRAEAGEEVLAGLRRFPDDRRLLEASVHLPLLSGDIDQAIRMLGLLDLEPSATTATSPAVLSGALAHATRNEDAAAARALAATAGAFAEALLDRGQAAGPLFADAFTFVARYGAPDMATALARRLAESADASPAGLRTAAEVLAERQDPGAAAIAARAAESGGLEAALLAARLAQESGDAASAEQLLRGALLTQPRNVPLLDALSAVLETQERWDEAVSVGRQAYTTAGATAARATLLAKLLLRAAQLDAAIEDTRRAAAAWPDDHETNALLGALLAENGALAEADAALNALALRLGHTIDSLELHVQIRYLRMDYGGAQALVAASDLTQDATPQVLRRMGWLHRRLTNLQDAIVLTRAAAESRDGDFTAHLQLVELLQETDKLDEALTAALSLVAENPLRERAHAALGGVYKVRGEIEKARACFDAALALNRNDNAAMMALALLEEEAGDFAGALDLYERWMAIAARSDQPAGLRSLWHAALNAIMIGKVDRALELHAQQAATFDETLADLAPVWAGERVDDGALVIAMRGGPGDELRIATTSLPWLLEERAARVRFACDIRVQTLLQRTFPEVEFIAVPSGHRQLRRKETGSQKLHDRLWPGVTARITDMAIPFGHVEPGDRIASSDTLFHHTYFEGVLRGGGVLRHRFLKPDPDRVDEMREFLETLGPGLRVGVCWRGSYRSVYRNRIFLEVDELAPLFELEGVRLINLQVNQDVYERNVASAAGLVTVPDLDLYDDFEGMAALMSQLDLVVTPGMTTRDLAGAVNVPVFSLVASVGASDYWRRQPDGMDRWQPSIRHFDVTTSGSRAEMVASLREAVAERVAARGEAAA